VRRLNGCATGEAKITHGYHLPARWVIHTVGPVWHGGGHGEDELLARCYRSCLALAEAHGLRTVAFPAISTGAYGFPLERATRIAIAETARFLAAHALPERSSLCALGKRPAGCIDRRWPRACGQSPPSAQRPAQVRRSHSRPPTPTRARVQATMLTRPPASPPQP